MMKKPLPTESPVVAGQIMKNSIHALLIVWIVVIAMLDVVTSAKNLPGEVRFYIMELNSMSPAVPANSLILTKPYPNYLVNEIITFEFPGSKEIVTHRVINLYGQNGQIYYITKGDNNEAVDRRLIPIENIFGKAIAVIPLLGWLVRFVDTKLGLILLVAVPATLVVRREIMVIKREIKKGMRKG